jgi:aspartyl protease family protein
VCDEQPDHVVLDGRAGRAAQSRAIDSGRAIGDRRCVGASFESAGQSEDTPSCSRHPETRATATCERCLAAICEICSVRADGTICIRCVRDRRRARERRVALICTGVIVAAVATPLVYRATSAPAGEAKQDTRVVKKSATVVEKAAAPVMSEQTTELSAAVDKEPCDRGKIVPLCDSLLRDGEPRLCLTRAEAFFTRCGDYWRLRWATYAAHKQLSEWEPAIGDATGLVTQFPDDRDYRIWRGLAYAEKGDAQHEVADYEQALAIEPRLTDLPFDLADAYRKLGRPCDGIFPLEQLSFYYPDRDANARRRLRELYDDPQCSDRMGTGKATLRFGTGARRVTSRVTLNGTTAADLIVDTGASTVVLGKQLATRLGLRYDQWPARRAATAAGIRDVRIGHLDSVTVQGVSARHVECAVIDDLVGLEGLLGLSFLARFEMHADPSKGVLTLVDRRAAAQ